MMFDSILVKVSCSEELLYLHTISRRHKSPYRFAILRDTLEQLEREPGRQIIVADCGCYAALRLTRALDGEMLVIRFSWLQSAGADSLRGYEEWVRLPYRRFHECVEAGTDMAGVERARGIGQVCVGAPGRRRAARKPRDALQGRPGPHGKNSPGGPCSLSPRTSPTDCPTPS